MQNTLDEAQARKPTLHISETDYDLIANYAMAVASSSPIVSKQLMEEIERAEVHPADELPPGVVMIGSHVEFLDEMSGETRQVRLVMPADANIDEGFVSILTPIGAALIGLSAGQTIDWPARDGRPRSIKILDVK